MKYNAFISYSHESDNKFAPALQNALQKFAKPWYKKRILEIFRDESNLSVSPHLWKNITEALDASEYLILLASPLSENSPWVNKEIEYWLENKTIDTVLIALTEGEIKWDIENNRFLNPKNNALPPALDEQFKEEPLYVDLRKSKTEEDLSLDNPIFKKEVLKLASKLHGKSPNELAGEDVVIHRKAMRLRNAAFIALGTLLIGALTACGFLIEANIKAAKTSEMVVEGNRENLKRISNTLRYLKEMDSINWREKRKNIFLEIDTFRIFRTRKEFDSLKKVKKN